MAAVTSTDRGNRTVTINTGQSNDPPNNDLYFLFQYIIHLVRLEQSDLNYNANQV